MKIDYTLQQDGEKFPGRKIANFQKYLSIKFISPILSLKIEQRWRKKSAKIINKKCILCKKAIENIIDIVEISKCFRYNIIRGIENSIWNLLLNILILSQENILYLFTFQLSIL